ncbi:MAG: TetR family transcriptional regulator [Deltaproteobacteria bacterium]|nr:TetR family transcriptional regulator [Deltaproteobacteria bacterium]
MSKAKNIQKREEIYSIIAHLFAHKGYHSTSMRDIARELGMNQSSLYHYFDGKEDMLFKLMNEAMDEALPTIEEICDADISPEEKLTRVLGYYTRYFAGEQEREILLVNEMGSLNGDPRRILLEKQRRYVHLIRTILDELADQGKMKKIHTTVALFAFFGMVHYTIKWYRKDGPVSLDELAGSFLEIFTRGILE